MKIDISCQVLGGPCDFGDLGGAATFLEWGRDPLGSGETRVAFRVPEVPQRDAGCDPVLASCQLKDLRPRGPPRLLLATWVKKEG